MITGVAIGYLVGCVVVFVLTLLFALLTFVNQYEGDLSQIYDPDTLDMNAEAEAEAETKDDPSGAKEKDG